MTYVFEKPVTRLGFILMANVVLAPGVGHTQEVSVQELRALREEFQTYKRASESRIRALEDKLAKTEARTTETVERIVKTEGLVSEVGSLAQEASARAKL